jgi:hypothetical protein
MQRGGAALPVPPSSKSASPPWSCSRVLSFERRHGQRSRGVFFDRRTRARYDRSIAYVKPIRCAVLLLLACVASSACSRKESRVERPNIVLLSIDTLRADSLRAYDPSSRPHETLDRLATQGRMFTRAYSTA